VATGGIGATKEQKDDNTKIMKLESKAQLRWLRGVSSSLPKFNSDK